MAEKTIAVSAQALHAVLAALVGPSHLIRELQATRDKPPFMVGNPIDTLINQYHAAIEATSAEPAPITHLQGQCLVLATLLETAVKVVNTIEPESSDEEDQIQAFIKQSTAAIETVLKEHAMPQTAGTPDIPVAHHPV